MRGSLEDLLGPDDPVCLGHVGPEELAEPGGDDG